MTFLLCLDSLLRFTTAELVLLSYLLLPRFYHYLPDMLGWDNLLAFGSAQTYPPPVDTVPYVPSYGGHTTPPTDTCRPQEETAALLDSSAVYWRRTCLL